MLSIMANHAVALPLAGSFPPGELAYILNQSQAIALLSSSKMQDKAEETLKEELDAKPMSGKVEKITESSDVKDVTLQDVKEDDDKGGLMLYTSGTTSRPVRISSIPKLAHSLASKFASNIHYEHRKASFSTPPISPPNPTPSKPRGTTLPQIDSSTSSRCTTSTVSSTRY